jgi:starch phosphorylase
VLSNGVNAYRYTVASHVSEADITVASDVARISLNSRSEHASEVAHSERSESSNGERYQHMLLAGGGGGGGGAPLPLSWKLGPIAAGIGGNPHDGIESPPPERQKDYIDEAEMDDDLGGDKEEGGGPWERGHGPRHSSGSGHHDNHRGAGGAMVVRARKDQLWKLCSSYLPSDVPSIQRSLVQHVEYTLARRRYKFDRGSFYQATAHSVRDRLIERWTDTQQFYASRDGKRMYYLSLEFLVGRSLGNAVSNLGLRGAYAEALRQLGYDMEDIIAEEKEPALGNGGLGRLASCFLDTLATLNYPAWGYGLRYKYGMFEQRLINGKQVEFPDYWLTYGNPWEVERLDVKYRVRLYGSVKSYQDDNTGEWRYRWEGGEVVVAVAYDTPIPGYGTYNTNNMRLWASKPSHEFDLASFNAGDYYGAVEAKERCESITSVLYPSDDNDNGKVLRLKQQFFFVSATLQDILRRYKKRIVPGRTLKHLPDKVAIQLNDTHPSISIPELMRLLLDDEMLPWEEAWDIVSRVFGYTNHTILPEALEKWPVPMLEELLPRHMQIIFEINHRFLQEVEAKWPGDLERLQAMSIIEESTPKMVRMAHLAVVGSHVVNGVAEIHTALVKTRLFPEFNEMWPGRIKNVTNGVTPRRWILQANPALSSIFTSILGPGWVNDLRRLETLKPLAVDPSFQNRWTEAKRTNKQRLAVWVKRNMGIDLMIDAIFDMQVKRIHEYKRQLLNVLSIVHRYAVIATSSAEQRQEMTPRVCIIAGKAAPGYEIAKKIIQLACGVSKVVNNDVRCANLLQVVFIPNFNVSLAELIIPASDVSQHISTAGMEASGTGNMKFVMNGGLIVGTADGANIEIARAVDRDDLFCFGATADEVAALRSTMHKREPQIDERLARVIRMIRSGVFGPPQDSEQLIDSLEPSKDFYLVGHDFPSYIDALNAADAAYRDRPGWTAKTIRAACSMWAFSSDRTIKEYAENVWGIEPMPFKPPHHQNPAPHIHGGATGGVGGGAGSPRRGAGRNGHGGGGGSPRK